MSNPKAGSAGPVRQASAGPVCGEYEGTSESDRQIAFMVGQIKAFRDLVMDRSRAAARE